jgi:transcriptional regulator with XRE-family HTH domain
MSESLNELKKEFQDKEYREAYADDFLNTSIATQLVVLREQRGLSQEKLAQEIGTHQAGISRIENVNYSAWNIRTLKKIAFALGGRLKVSIETFGSLLDEAENFSRKALERPSFDDDPAFKEQSAIKETDLEEKKLPNAAKTLEEVLLLLMPQPSDIEASEFLTPVRKSADKMRSNPQADFFNQLLERRGGSPHQGQQLPVLPTPPHQQQTTL